MVEGGGPLAGVRVVEIGSIGPGPLCAMLLADLGADVLRIDRVGAGPPLGPGGDHTTELLHRGRRSVAVDLKSAGGVEVVLRLVGQADALIEGFRPGVAERLGIGPDACWERNSGLVYGRMTGWGQDGPMSQDVGHDLNYIALSGVLGMIGRAGQPPTPPLNLVGDGGGGGLMLAFGILAALLERGESGRGQVVDAAMIEGSAVLATPFFGYRQVGGWSQRGTNLVDGGAPFYDTYETADSRWLSVAAIEPRFYADLLSLLELDPNELPEQYDRGSWPEMKERVAGVIRSKPRDEWVERAANLDACVAPVLEFDELEDHPHLSARRTFLREHGMLQPAPAPRFSRSSPQLRLPPPEPGEHTREALMDWGFDDDEVAALAQEGSVGV